ncbi:hypothetical protein LJK87_15740 [Paenibacillus sp. P25]|nr:hypothetical protein LJK87_15740 [Paenibacillus sp. P25]
MDASNCHLVFDLQMKSLGNTLLDVQVVNRIVSLHVRNDLPFTAELLESRKDEITEALASIGYQFLSMKCSPYPVLQLAGAEKSLEGTGGQAAAALPSAYVQKPYKGVDIRV